MGPALAVRHGMALGTEVYSQYGMGWPCLAGMFSQLVPLTYGNLVSIAVVYGCVYFCGLYWLIRLYTGAAAWAALGTFIRQDQ